jgi:hypothetical protein
MSHFLLKKYKRPTLSRLGLHAHTPETPTNDASRHVPSNQDKPFRDLADFDRQCEQWYRDHAFSTTRD